MSQTKRLWIVSVAIALLAAALAILLRAALTPLWGERFIFTFSFPAVVVAAWYGRQAAGLLTTAVLTVAGAYYGYPLGSLAVNGVDDVLALSLFAVFGVLISGIVNRLHVEIERSQALVDAAREADMQRSAVLESIPDGFMVLDRTFRLVFVNAQAERMLGAEPGTLGGQSLAESFPAAVGTPLEAALRRVATTATAEHLEHFFPPLDRWLQARMYPAGERGVSVLFEDVTAAKRMLDRLRESSSTLEAIVEGTDDFIYGKDLQGRFTLANRAVLELLGKERDAVIGCTVKDVLTDPAAAASITESDRRVLEQGRTETVEESVVTRFGTTVYLATKSPRFDENGRVIGLIGIATDITARKRVESELRTAHDSLAQEVGERTAELVELSHHLMQVTEGEKARLAAELHDALGGSLTTLVIGLARLKSRLEPVDGEQGAAFARIEATLQDVVNMARRIIGDLRPVTLDTLGLAATLRDHADKWSRQTGVDVRMTMPSSLPACTADVALTVFRIVQETLTNVAKHAYASVVEITIAPVRDGLEVVIEDNGVGIKRQGARRAGAHGLLGMRERASGCGGSLRFDQGAAGRGTRVELRVPAAVPPPTGRAAAQEG
ncbi:MAG: PAS domain-containing protein [Casimicrobiaceae bacterium]